MQLNSGDHAFLYHEAPIECCRCVNERENEVRQARASVAEGGLSPDDSSKGDA